MGPSGAIDGDGSEESPLRQPADAIALAVEEARTSIVLGAGLYESNLRIGFDAPDLALRGRCSSLVILEAPDFQQPAIRVTYDADADVSGLTLRG